MHFGPRRRTRSPEPGDRVATRRMPAADPWADQTPPPDPWSPPPGYPQQDPWGPPQDPWAAPPPDDRRPGRRRTGSRRDSPPPLAAPPRPRRRRRLLRRVGAVAAVLFVVQALVVLSLRWIDPPTTAFMAANPDGAIQQSVPIEHVSRNLLASVIAHEDQDLPYRGGAFDWSELAGRAEAHLKGGEDPSGSTIPQQVAKNVFLTSSMSVWRKGLEAALSTEMAYLLDDRRMLELYVNYAQFGPTIYGICSASWYYFDTPPSTLTVDQSAQLVGLLPSPGHVQRAPGGGLDFDVADGKGWLSRTHVLNAQKRVPPHLASKGFGPVEDVGVEGLASNQPESGDDCSSRPDAIAQLIAEEGTG